MGGVNIIRDGGAAVLSSEEVGIAPKEEGATTSSVVHSKDGVDFLGLTGGLLGSSALASLGQIISTSACGASPISLFSTLDILSFAPGTAMPGTIGEGILMGGVGALAAEIVLATLGGAVLGYTLVESGAGHYLGLEAVGNLLGNAAWATKKEIEDADADRPLAGWIIL